MDERNKTMNSTTMHRTTSHRPLVLAATVVVILTVGIWLWNSGSASNAGVTHDAISQPRGAATSADVEIAMSVGEVRIGALDESTNLIAGDIEYPDLNSVERRFTVRGDTASFTLREQDNRASNLIRFRNSGSSWNLRLSPDVPLRLKLENGIGEANIDLAQLKVFDLSLDNGIGSTTLTLPRQGKVQARVSRSVGETTIRVPSGVAVRLKVDGGLGNVKVPPTYWQQENMYVSPDYDTATNRVDLTASSGIGDITIQHISE
jgi:hypothetical protein